MAGAKAGGKGKSSSSSGSSFAGGSSHSLLDYSRPGLSGFCKWSASPACGGGGKRGRGGRGVSPAPEVGVMSLSLDNRRLFVAPLAGVERQGRRTLGGGSAAVGLSDTLPHRSSSVLGAHPLSGLCPIVHPGQGLGTGSSFPCREGCSRAGSPSLSRVLQPLICCDESLRVMETHDRPFHSEPSSPQVSIQDGGSPVHARVGEALGLDGVFRYPECLLAGASSSGQPQVPKVHGLGPGVSIQAPLFRSLHCPSGFHEGHGSGVSLSPSFRYMDSSVSR